MNKHLKLGLIVFTVILLIAFGMTFTFYGVNTFTVFKLCAILTVSAFIGSLVWVTSNEIATTNKAWNALYAMERLVIVCENYEDIKQFNSLWNKLIVDYPGMGQYYNSELKRLQTIISLKLQYLKPKGESDKK